MNIGDFRRILTAFADDAADLDLVRGQLLVQIRDEVIEASVSQRDGTIWIDEDGDPVTAFRWLVNRIARLPLLADRILSYVPAPEHFVTPAGKLLDQPEFSATDEQQEIADATRSIRTILGRRPGGSSSVLYLTSDAGEGKTTIINHVAREQAAAYKRKEAGADWLLVPITLGGRPFLRFDDVVIGALVNRLRFQLFYYEGFIELVKLGVIVPAFDGFEEMFIESSSGEALSALGNLMNMLQSSGSVLIAARKAYFEYKSFATQTRLYDAIGNDSVAFARLALERWSKQQFLEYAAKRGVQDPSAVHSTVANRLTPTHPLLTRAVLVRRLIDVAADGSDLSALLTQLGTTPQDYFFQFVNAIVERESTEKWIDRSGDAAQPLISTVEHHSLLSMVAHEMWVSSTESLPGDVLDLIADLFSESTRKSPVISRQIKERLKQHSLIASSEGVRSQFTFDHEDFRKFFLGEALGRTLRSAQEAEIRRFLQVGPIPSETADAAVQFLRRTVSELSAIIEVLQRVNRSEIPTSFVRENCGGLIVRLLDGLTPDNLNLSDALAAGQMSISQVAFPPDALRGRGITSVKFADCYFQPTSLDDTQLTASHFVSCRFDRLEFRGNTTIAEVELIECEVRSVVDLDSDDRFYDPAAIKMALTARGIVLGDEHADATSVADTSPPDERLVLVERALRLFLRATHINENSFRARFGARAGAFFEDVLPVMIESGAIEEVQYLGAGRQRRFKLSVPMRVVENAIRSSHGSFDELILHLSKSND
jgi:hypothetical protein